ncbi:hypothetical protein Anas_11647, partial [Armadillidium nasatum]
DGIINSLLKLNIDDDATEIRVAGCKSNYFILMPQIKFPQVIWMRKNNCVEKSLSPVSCTISFILIYESFSILITVFAKLTPHIKLIFWSKYPLTFCLLYGQVLVPRKC